MLNKNFSNRPLYGVFLSGAQKVLDRPLYRLLICNSLKESFPKLTIRGLTLRSNLFGGLAAYYRSVNSHIAFFPQGVAKSFALIPRPSLEKFYERNW